MIRSVLERAGHKTGMIGTLGIVIDQALFQPTTPRRNRMKFSGPCAGWSRRGAPAQCWRLPHSALNGTERAGFNSITAYLPIFPPTTSGAMSTPPWKNIWPARACFFAIAERDCSTGTTPAGRRCQGSHLRGVHLRIFAWGRSVAVNDRLVTRPGFLGAAFELHGALECSVEVGIPGKFSVYNALAAAAVCREFGVSVQAPRRGCRR